MDEFNLKAHMVESSLYVTFKPNFGPHFRPKSSPLNQPRCIFRNLYLPSYPSMVLLITKFMFKVETKKGKEKNRRIKKKKFLVMYFMDLRPNIERLTNKHGSYQIILSANPPNLRRQNHQNQAPD